MSIQNYIVTLDLHVRCTLSCIHALVQHLFVVNLPRKNALDHHAKYWGWPLLLKNVGPPYAPWCTMQIGSAQRRLMAHNVALYL